MKAFILGVLVTLAIMNPSTTSQVFASSITAINHVIAPTDTYSANILGKELSVTVPK